MLLGLFATSFFQPVYTSMAGQEKVMFPWCTKCTVENLSRSDDALGKEHRAWLLVDVGSGPTPVTYLLRNIRRAPEPLCASAS